MTQKSISKKEIIRIAELARIKLSPEEEIKFEKEISELLVFFEKLNEVDTRTTVPLTGGTTEENITREDGALDPDLEGRQARILAQAPEKKENWIKVKAIF